jgi:ribosomal protein S18 acetylase RimI-like enzyme
MYADNREILNDQTIFDPDKPTAIIVPLLPNRAHSVARLHLQFLPSDFGPWAGERLLTMYYAEVAAGAGASGYIAELDGEVVGYVCGVWQPRKLHRLLVKGHWPKLILWGAAQHIERPVVLAKNLRRICAVFRRSGPSDNGYELRPIVVSSALHGSGISGRLVKALLADAAIRGFDRVHLYVDVNNYAAIRFYEKQNFQRAGLKDENGIGYIRYERRVKIGEENSQ